MLIIPYAKIIFSIISSNENTKGRNGSINFRNNQSSYMYDDFFFNSWLFFIINFFICFSQITLSHFLVLRVKITMIPNFQFKTVQSEIGLDLRSFKFLMNKIWLINGFVTMVTRLVPLVEQQLVTLLEHLRAPMIFVEF